MCLVTHSCSDKLVLNIQYFITQIWCIGCAQSYDLTLILQPIPIPTNKKVLRGSEEKIMCHISIRFRVIISSTWILTDTVLCKSDANTCRRNSKKFLVFGRILDRNETSTTFPRIFEACIVLNGSNFRRHIPWWL